MVLGAPSTLNPKPPSGLGGLGIGVWGVWVSGVQESGMGWGVGGSLWGTVGAKLRLPSSSPDHRHHPIRTFSSCISVRLRRKLRLGVFRTGNEALKRELPNIHARKQPLV